MKQRWVIAAVLVAALFIMTGVVFGAITCVLRIQEIPGESVALKHEGEIDILTWSWGEAQAGTAGRSAGTALKGAGKVQFQEFAFTMYLNKASVNLVKYGASGQPLKSAVLTCIRTGGKAPQDFLTFKLSNSVVSSYKAGTLAAGDRFVDQFSLMPARVDMEYKMQRPDQSVGTSFSTTVGN
jgi:type VI secretion system secreted protein Hcp